MTQKIVKNLAVGLATGSGNAFTGLWQGMKKHPVLTIGAIGITLIPGVGELAFPAFCVMGAGTVGYKIGEGANNIGRITADATGGATSWEYASLEVGKQLGLNITETALVFGTASLAAPGKIATTTTSKTAPIVIDDVVLAADDYVAVEVLATGTDGIFVIYASAGKTPNPHSVLPQLNKYFSKQGQQIEGVFPRTTDIPKRTETEFKLLQRLRRLLGPRIKSVKQTEEGTNVLLESANKGPKPGPDVWVTFIKE